MHNTLCVYKNDYDNVASRILPKNIKRNIYVNFCVNVESYRVSLKMSF